MQSDRLTVLQQKIVDALSQGNVLVAHYGPFQIYLGELKRLVPNGPLQQVPTRISRSTIASMVERGVLTLAKNEQKINGVVEQYVLPHAPPM